MDWYDIIDKFKKDDNLKNKKELIEQLEELLMYINCFISQKEIYEKENKDG